MLGTQTGKHSVNERTPLNNSKVHCSIAMDFSATVPTAQVRNCDEEVAYEPSGCHPGGAGLERAPNNNKLSEAPLDFLFGSDCGNNMPFPSSPCGKPRSRACSHKGGWSHRCICLLPNTRHHAGTVRCGPHTEWQHFVLKWLLPKTAKQLENIGVVTAKDLSKLSWCSMIQMAMKNVRRIQMVSGRV
jgi:hypothetical protein